MSSFSAPWSVITSARGVWSGTAILERIPPDRQIGRLNFSRIICPPLSTPLFFFCHKRTIRRARFFKTTERPRSRGRPPRELREWRRLKNSSLEVLQKNATLRACLRECRDGTKSFHSICLHIRTSRSLSKRGKKELKLRARIT